MILRDCQSVHTYKTTRSSHHSHSYFTDRHIMYSSIILRFWVESFHHAIKLEERATQMLFVLSILVACLAAWRIWAFTILPKYMGTREPRELPYWTPGLGHGLNFFFNFGGLLTCGRKTFGNKLYIISLGGLKMCIATSPSDISAIYKDTQNLSFDPFMKEMLRRVGVSSAACEKWIPSPPDLDSNSSGSSSSAAAAVDWVSGDGHQQQRDNKGATKPKPSIHEISHVGQKLCRQQLLPGKEFDVLSTKLIRDIEQSLQWHNISSAVTVVSTSTSTTNGNGTKRVSLLAWCREVLILSATRSFFSDRLLQIDPHLIDSFYNFDADSWKAFFKFPPFLSREMDAGKDRIIDALSRYFSLPKDERKDESWLISNLETEMIKAGINDVAEMASIVMPLYWVINANAYRSAFWTLAYVLQDQSLIAALRKEISPLFAQGTTNLGSRIENCALLESVYFESLRLSSSSATVRTVRNTTTIGDFTLRKGIEVLVPYCQLHLDKSVWGPSPAQFNPERFLKNSHLKQSASFKPFGGGSTYCPGRFLARQEIMTFVALVLHRFDVTLSPLPSDGPCGGTTSKKQRMPRIDHKKLAVSLMSPIAGEDLLVDVKPATRL